MRLAAVFLAVLLGAGCSHDQGPSAQPCSTYLDCPPLQLCVEQLCQPAARGPDGGATNPAGGPCGDDGDCSGSAYCSVLGSCVAPGYCLDDGDCAGAERCGIASRSCLASPDDCALAGDCRPGFTCQERTCVIGGECGGVEFGTTRLAPNVLILLDRSGSMGGALGTSTRWDVAKEAIRQATTTFDEDIRFGLAVFSACLPGGCSAGEIVVPIASGNAAAVNTFLAPLRSSGSGDGSPPDFLCDSGDPETTIGPSLAGLVGEPSLQDSSRLNAVLLLTDGEESRSCLEGGAPDGAGGAARLFAQSVAVRTYAVGFTSDSDPKQLDGVALAGGTEHRFQADDAAALLSALEKIATEVASCDFALSVTAEDPNQIYVFFDNDPAGVERGGADGWSYDPATGVIHFLGAACDRVKAGSVSDIDVVYGCPHPIID